ncbi:hypothetical protein [Rufibacter sp. XAAS-G3-1]|uniref:hypothetical protein n=1 Tax=Rufibacter sp. XAAS-G3-1 TaxID=2729134 RepID=UPI0015E72A5C|nr:hypothetical protein [Rufibacter sp. XAAS-G3-1]
MSSVAALRGGATANAGSFYSRLQRKIKFKHGTCLEFFMNRHLKQFFWGKRQAAPSFLGYFYENRQKTRGGYLHTAASICLYRRFQGVFRKTGAKL